MVGYWLNRSDSEHRLFLGTTADEVAEAIRKEIESNEGLPAYQCSALISAVEMTQAEIDAVPELPTQIQRADEGDDEDVH